jgi:hypothetical protein
MTICSGYIIDTYCVEELVHPLKRASSSCVYSQCVVHIVVGPCAKGHFIHVGFLDSEFFFFFWRIDWFITNTHILQPLREVLWLNIFYMQMKPAFDHVKNNT